MPDDNDLVYTQYGIDVDGLLRRLYELITGIDATPDSVADTLFSIWQIFSVVSFAISGLLLFGIIYSIVRFNQLEEAVHESLHEAEHAHAHAAHAHETKNERWRQASEHIESDNPNDWRLAIIEADIVLEGLLDKLGYGGVTIGDKLKQANPQFFKTIEDAWKAHKVRNDIAHRGSDFILTKRLAKETLEQYRRVFEEFSVI